MCGIAGIVSDNKNYLNNITATTASLSRRGPDNQEVKFISDCAVLGHTRLSIIDLLARSNQPLSSDNERYTITFNGEIYNYRELRSQLEAKGIIFKTTSDTEVILNGFIIEKEKFLTRMEGMWAFAIWDDEKKELFMSRDRFGEKPLYYLNDSQGFSFASNLGALSSFNPGLSINKNAVAELIATQYIHSENCIYHGIKKLPPASWLRLSASKAISTGTYWSPDYTNKISITEEEALADIDRLLTNAIEKEITSADVPVGLFLSGGVDSGLIAAIASKIHPGIEAITMSVPGSARNELDFARIIAQKHKLKLHEVPMNEKCVGDLPYLLTDIEPLADSSLLPLSYVAGAASRLMKVALTGDGGDEIFGGYGSPALFMKNDAGKLSSLKKGIYNYLINRRYNSYANKLLKRYYLSQASFNTFGISLFYELQDSATSYILNMVMGKDHQRSSINRIYESYASQHSTNINDDVSAVMLTGIKGRLAGDFLHKVDSGTMFHSLESRSPFLHHPLLDYVSKLPNEIVFNRSTDKYLLKKLASKYNPPEIVYASKKGFSIPVEAYFEKGWKKLLQAFLKEGVSEDLGIFKRNGVEKLLNQHSSFKPFRLSNQLYAILVMEIWLRAAHLKTHTPEQLKEKILASI